MKQNSKTYQGLSLVYLALGVIGILCLISISKKLIGQDFFGDTPVSKKDFLLFHLATFILVGVLYCFSTITTVFWLEDSVKFKIVKIVYKWRNWNLKLLSVLLLLASLFNYGIYEFFQIKFISFFSTTLVISLYVITLTFTHPRMKKVLEKRELKSES